MRPPGFMPPGWKRPPALDAEVKKNQKAQRLLGQPYVETEDDTPMFRESDIKLDKIVNRFRNKKTGRFAKTPPGRQLRKKLRKKVRKR